jgi:hypothetical protein
VRDAVVGAVVLTVIVDVPEALATEAGLNEHAGGRLTTGVMLQDRVTAPLKPLCAVIVIVDVAETPAATEAGESAEAATVKSGGPVTVRLSAEL